MSATQEVSRFPRAEGEYVITEDVRREHIGSAVSRKTGVDFPFDHTSDVLERIETKPLVDLLTQMVSKSHHPDRLNSVRGQMKNSAQVMNMYVTWVYNDEQTGVKLRLMLVISSLQTIEVRIPEVIHAIRDISQELHPLVTALLENGGLQSYTWDELGIEEAVPIAQCFELFRSRYSIVMDVQHAMRTLAEHGPNPFSNPNPKDRGYIPASAYSAVVAQWSRQWQEMYATLGMRR
jgi:hypothetical protein